MNSRESVEALWQGSIRIYEYFQTFTLRSAGFMLRYNFIIENPTDRGIGLYPFVYLER